jgi:chromosome segregation ATPase
MTITEKHRTEFKLIDQTINELTRVMQKIATLETAAEEYASQLRNLEEQYLQEKTKSDALSIDLERMTAERNRLQAEIKDLQVSINAEREILKEDLRRETTGRKEAIKRLQNSFTQIQDLMNSVQHFMEPSSREDQ